jgi:hypothetical protein
VVTRNEMPAKENMLQKGKRANKITRRTKMVMVTKNQKPGKKVAQKGDQITDASGAQLSYYRDFQPSRRSDPSRSKGCSTGAHAELISADVICYTNAIFRCIGSCVNLGYYDDFLRKPPKEEHRHFKLYTSLDL